MLMPGSMQVDLPLVGSVHGPVLRPAQRVRPHVDHSGGYGASCAGLRWPPGGRVCDRGRPLRVRAESGMDRAAEPRCSSPMGRASLLRGRVKGNMCGTMTTISTLLLSVLTGAASIGCGGDVMEGTSGASSSTSTSSPITTSGSTATTPTASTSGSGSSTIMRVNPATSTSSTGGSSGSSEATPTSAPMMDDMPQCELPPPDCDPPANTQCPDGKVCSYTLKLCLAPCLRPGDCEFDCISQGQGNIDPHGLCPPCDTGVHGDCFIELTCMVSDDCAALPGWLCQTGLTWCLPPCTPECEYPCIDDSLLELGEDICPTCDLSEVIKP